MFQDLAHEVVSHWWDLAFIVGVGVLSVLIVIGADFASSVVYARKHPENEMARKCARTDALSFWIALATLALVPLLWPMYLGLGLGILLAAVYNLFKNLIALSWKEIN